ncbi:MAG: sensor histidine kinase [Bacteroidaceae bacterium]|nr:sensor histidine kinase [Bacteroidaceae bacterium]
MKKIKTKDIWLFVAQVMLLLLIMLSPTLINYISSRDAEQTRQSFWISAYWLGPMVGEYLLNFYLIIPLCWFKHRYWQFGVANVALIFLSNLHLIGNDISNLPSYVQAGFSSFVFISFLLCIMAIGAALSIRYLMRRSERRHKEIEAELAWLKNQINPHFLFNTLNNISSLAQIDGNETQEAIMQLSDLLRYAMYETNKPKVRIDGEVEFMRNYIELMKLRCNEMTTVSAQFTVTDAQKEVAPLLFISLIENAFKHGMNSNAPASIDIGLKQQDDTLVFHCDNTNNPKPTKDRSGSGIGLENTKRRLELLYSGRYTWEQEITPENIYHVKISIRL